MLKRYSALGALLILASLSASAQTVSWDASGTHPTVPASQGGTGNWTSSSANFSNGATDAAFPSGDTAYFGGTAGTVTLNYTPTLAGMQFASNNYTITGGTLSFNTSSAISYVGTVSTAITENINSIIAGSNLTFNTTDTAETSNEFFIVNNASNTISGTLTIDDSGVTSNNTGSVIVEFANAGALGTVTQINLNGGTTNGVYANMYLGTGTQTSGFTAGSGVTVDMNTKGAIMIGDLAAGSGATNTWQGNLVLTASGANRNTAADTTLVQSGTLSNGSAVTGALNFTVGVGQSAGLASTSSVATNTGADIQLNGVISNGGTGSSTLSMIYYQSGSATAGYATGVASAGNALNTYTGTTTIKSMTVNVAALANGGAASSLGESSNAATNLVIGGNPYYTASGTSTGQVGSGVLQYTGSGSQTTDRLFEIGTAAVSTANNATIDASGTGSGTISFTNTGALVLVNSSGTYASNAALYLTGSNTGLNTFDPLLPANPTGFTTSLVKQGAGTWALGNTGGSTYSGGTTVSNGTLLVDNTGTSGTGTGAVSVLGSSTGTATLGGTGSIKPTSSNAVAVGAYGVLAPGNGSDAVTNLAINGTGSSATNILTLAGGANAPSLTFNLNSGLASNQLNVTGTGVSYYGGSSTSGSGNVINFNDLTSGALSFGLYTLITEPSETGLTLGAADPLNAGYDVIAGGLLEGTGLSAYTSQLEFNTSNDTVVLDVVSAAPEPSTYALLLGGLGFLIFWHRRNRDSGAGIAFRSDKAKS